MQAERENVIILKIIGERFIEDRMRAIKIPEEYLRPILSNKKSRTESENKG